MGRRIGVLMMVNPGKPTYAYVRTSVLQWLESAGLEIVLIPPTITGLEAAAYFEHVNGLYLHPDWADDPAYLRLVRTFLTMAVAAAAKGDYFPVWGTCLGYELMIQHVGGLKWLEKFDARRFSKRTRLHLRATPEESRLLSHASAAQLDHLTHTFGPFFDHDYGLSVGRFMRNKALKGAFRILSTSHDRAGKEYISMVDGRRLPFYGTQFHPDNDRENRMEWMADFMRSEMRKSRHKSSFTFSQLPVKKGFCLGEMGYRIPCWRFDL